MQYFTEDDLKSQDALYAALRNLVDPIIVAQNAEADLITATYQADITPHKEAFDAATQGPAAIVNAHLKPHFDLATQQSAHIKQMVEDFALKMAKKTVAIWKKYEKVQAKERQKFELKTVAEQAIFDEAVKERREVYLKELAAVEESVKEQTAAYTEEYHRLAEQLDLQQRAGTATEADTIH